jgi:hypothetical protein
MKKLIAAVACVVALTIGAFAWLESNRAVDAETGVGERASLVQATLASESAPPASAAPETTAAVQRELPVAPTHGSLRYRFLWEEDRTPAAGVFVHFVVWGRQNPQFAAIELQPDHNGEIALAELEPGRVGIYVDRADGASRTIVC